MPSSFFVPGSTTKEGQLTSLHLSRNELLPVKLRTVAARVEDTGYAEGVVTNTKFGSFPHSTLIGVPWGSQVLASKVDTGTRGRVNPGHGRKRKANQISADSPNTTDDVEARQAKEATAASSGFLHILPPTPESWTSSLPHRTQVVYTPDYSYILHRLKARPGSTLIEAGSGSGSFTHAAARAVYNGDHGSPSRMSEERAGHRPGRVYTFEFHAERHRRVLEEMQEHNLENIVTATHRDVYKDGFWLRSDDGTYLSPQANAIFLDLPAPWEALPHLTRTEHDGKPPVLDAHTTATICTFSPCIEQVQKTTSVMRKLGWLEIDMVEIQHKRIDVRREYTGLEFEGYRGVNLVASDVDEALNKLREVEDNARAQQASSTERTKRPIVQDNQKQQDASKMLWKQGQLISRSEPELKTHTSYLVFAVLPRLWTEEDEELVRARTSHVKGIAPVIKSQKQIKKEAKQQKFSSAETNGSTLD